jgi:polysaccharide pyruvyl transferase WcaK-like protein
LVVALDRDPAARDAWAAGVLGNRRRLPYVMPAAALPSRWRVAFHGVGGVGFAALAPAARAEAVAALRAAAFVSVRDPATRAALREAGVPAALVPDAASRTSALLGERITRRDADGELAGLARRMPGWIALQLAAAWGDDATLARIAAAVVRSAVEFDAGIVLFRAGLAPWHDDAEVVSRLAARIAAEAPDVPFSRFDSADVFELCALLAQANAYVGTSLHGWIVADSFGVPGVCLVEHGAAKAARYVDCWNTGPASGWVSRDALADAKALHVLLRMRR